MAPLDELELLEDEELLLDVAPHPGSGAPAHFPWALQTSPLVQASPSSHAAPGVGV